MKKLPQYRLEAALLLVLALMTGALLADPQTRLQRGLRDGLAALCAVLALLLLRTLFRAKWRRRLIAQLQRAAAAAAVREVFRKSRRFMRTVLLRLQIHHFIFISGTSGFWSSSSSFRTISSVVRLYF